MAEAETQIRPGVETPSAAATVPEHLKLDWHQRGANHWWLFRHVPLEDLQDTQGVYIIWHSGQNPAVVYVGSGRIADRFRSHRLDGRIMSYAPSGLGVTWAEVPPEKQRGVERFLADTLSPVAGGRYPHDDHIAVNLPW